MTPLNEINRELDRLNNAHCAGQIQTAEYRRLRRRLLRAAEQQRDAVTHTLRRPARVIHAPRAVSTQHKTPPLTLPDIQHPGYWIIGLSLFILSLIWHFIGP